MRRKKQFACFFILLILLLSACTSPPAASPTATAGFTAPSAPVKDVPSPAAGETSAPLPAATQPATPVSTGPFITVPLDGDTELINLRGGPGTTFPVIGHLPKGATAPAVGRIGAEWIMIRYPEGPEGTAWLYAPLVTLTGEIPDLKTPMAP